MLSTLLLSTKGCSFFRVITSHSLYERCIQRKVSCYSFRCGCINWHEVMENKSSHAWQWGQHSAGWKVIRNLIRPYSPHWSHLLFLSERAWSSENTSKDEHFQLSKLAIVIVYRNTCYIFKYRLKVRQLIFISFPQSLKYVSHPAWGSVHITKKQWGPCNHLQQDRTPTKTDRKYKLMHFGLSVSQKPHAGFCCCFLQRQNNLWKTDVSEIHHVKLQVQEIHITFVLLSKCAHRANDFIIIL